VDEKAAPLSKSSGMEGAMFQHFWDIERELTLNALEALGNLRKVDFE
jgi:hypothetical protein